MIAVLALILLIVLLRRRRKKRLQAAAPAVPQPPAEAPGSAGGIYVRLEVLQGAYLGQSQEFTLATELVIGAGQRLRSGL